MCQIRGKRDYCHSVDSFQNTSNYHLPSHAVVVLLGSTFVLYNKIPMSISSAVISSNSFLHVLTCSFTDDGPYAERVPWRSPCIAGVRSFLLYLLLPFEMYRFRLHSQRTTEPDLQLLVGHGAPRSRLCHWLFYLLFTRFESTCFLLRDGVRLYLTNPIHPPTSRDTRTKTLSSSNSNYAPRHRQDAFSQCGYLHACPPTFCFLLRIPII